VKAKIRKQSLDARVRLTPEQRKVMSAEIEAKLFGLPEYRAASIVMFYASFQSEVETHRMIRRPSQRQRVVLPKVKGRNWSSSRLRT